MADEPFRTITEPFRIHSVEPMRLTTAQQRADALSAAGYNMFRLRAEDVLIDLLSDSGTGAMSAEQWAAIQRGNEAYAGAPSFYRFRRRGDRPVPVPACLARASGPGLPRRSSSRRPGLGRVVPNNTHFDTTRANIEFTGPQAIDLPIQEGFEPALRHPFKGNMDVAALERLLAERATRSRW